MKWAHFLHVYQPAEQQKEILEAVIEQSYRPLFTYFRDNPVHITLNINGALLDLFHAHGHDDLISMLKEAGEKGHIEFTGSAKYHSFLPFLSADEIERQIQINTDTLKKYLGDSCELKGFFPPEMAFVPELVPVLEKLGFKWIIMDEIAYNGKPGNVDYNNLYHIAHSSLTVFFKERRVSNVIMSALARSLETIVEVVKDTLATDTYLLTGMDGETFGHHRPGLELMLFDLLKDPRFTFVCISDILADTRTVIQCSPLPSTWATSQRDIERGTQFLSWSDPENAIHALQMKLLKLALSLIEKADTKDPKYPEMRHRMDIGTASDHFWWASAKPWWSVEMIEDGAYKLVEAIRAVPQVSSQSVGEASVLYEQIISTAFHWQRTGKIRSMIKDQQSIIRIPFKDRTFGKGGAEEGVYHAFIDMMKKLEQEASKKGEYEKAILWRDAQYKIEHRVDIYDAIHAVDLLRTYIPYEEVEATIQKYKATYASLRGGQVEQRGS